MIMHNFRFFVSWPLHCIRRCTILLTTVSYAKPTTQIQEFFNEIMAWRLKKSKAVQTCSSSTFSISQVALFCKSVQLTKCSQDGECTSRCFFILSLTKSARSVLISPILLDDPRSSIMDRHFYSCCTSIGGNKVDRFLSIFI